MSLIVTSYDLKVDGGCENCRCSRLHDTTQKESTRQKKIPSQKRKGAKLLLIVELPLRLCAFASEMFLGTAHSFLLVDSRHSIVFKDPIDLRTPLFHYLFNLVPQLR